MMIHLPVAKQTLLKKVLAKDLGNDVNEVLGQAPIDLCVIFRLPLLLLLNPPTNMAPDQLNKLSRLPQME